MVVLLRAFFTFFFLMISSILSLILFLRVRYLMMDTFFLKAEGLGGGPTCSQSSVIRPICGGEGSKRIRG